MAGDYDMKIYVLDEYADSKETAAKIGLRYLDAIQSAGDPLSNEYSGRDLIRVFGFDRNIYYLASEVKDIKEAPAQIYLIMGSPYRGLVLVEEHDYQIDVLCYPHGHYKSLHVIVPKKDPELFIIDAINEYALEYYRSLSANCNACYQ